MTGSAIEAVGHYRRNPVHFRDEIGTPFTTRCSMLSRMPAFISPLGFHGRQAYYAMVILSIITQNALNSLAYATAYFNLDSMSILGLSQYLTTET